MNPLTAVEHGLRAGNIQAAAAKASDAQLDQMEAEAHKVIANAHIAHTLGRIDAAARATAAANNILNIVHTEQNRRLGL